MAITKERFIAREVRKARCNCGGPQYGTAHSPDCALLLAYDVAEELWKDMVYENRLKSIDAANARGELTPEEYNEACHKAAFA